MTVPSKRSRPHPAPRRDEIEVVGRFVQEQQRCTGELEQQDLEARLLPARERLERLVGARLHLVPTQHAHRRSEHHVVVVEDLDERATDPLRMIVSLVEQAPRPRPSRHLPSWSVG